MEFAILACCAVIIVLLVVLLTRSGGGDAARIAELEQQIAVLREGVKDDNGRLIDRVNENHSRLMEQVFRQGQDTVTTVINLGKGINEGQDRQQDAYDKRLHALEEKFDAIRRDTLGALEKVRQDNADSLDKLRTDNQASLDKINETVNEKLQKTLNDGQAASDKRLLALEEKFDAIRRDTLDALEKVRQDNAASLDKLRTDNQASLDRINETVNEKLQKTLNDRITQSFELVNQRLTQVYEGLGEMKNVASGVSDLKNVLSNVKNRGIMGEIQLSAILGDILAPEQYETQFKIRPGGPEMVDFAVKLPGLDDGEYVYLPIDSKFPGDRWAALADAYDSGNPVELKQKRAALEQEIKRCAKSIHDKYIVPPYSTDFAILFLPFEGLYAEVVNMGLVEVLQRDYRVNITGPSTMAAMLNSLQMGFRTLAIQKKSGEVWKILEAAKKEFANFETVLTKTRDRLRQADDELEKLIGTRTRAINRKLSAVASLDASENAADLLELPQ